MSTSKVKLCFIVLNFNDFNTTHAYIKTIENYKIIDRIIVVDNCSTDDSFDRLCLLRSNKIDVIKTKRNGGYGYGNNYGMRYAIKTYNCDFLCISNPDVEVGEKTIINCVNFLEKNSEYACVAPLMINNDGTYNYKCAWKIPSRKQYLLFSLTLLGRFYQNMYYQENEMKNSKYMDVGCVAGSFLIFNAKKINEVGMYDESVFLYCEETVIGIKLASKGFKTALITNCSFVHHHSVSINKSFNGKKKQRELTWNSRLKVLDKYYNGNAMKNLIALIISRIEIYECVLIDFCKRKKE